MFRPTALSKPFTIARRAQGASTEMQSSSLRIGQTTIPSDHVVSESRKWSPVAPLARHGATHFYSSSSFNLQASSPFASGRGKKMSKKDKFMPRKAAVNLTENARTLFKKLLDSKPDKIGIVLNYDQSSTGEPRMVFSFDFMTAEQLHPEDEGVSLELLEDGSPKLPAQSWTDGLPKLYVHHNAFMKVLGATLDIDPATFTPILFDREGNRMDPNA